MYEVPGPPLSSTTSVPISWTVTVTVASFDVAPSLSFTVYLNSSGPVKPVPGVYVTVPSPLTTTSPLLGPLVTTTVPGSIVPSLSVSFSTTFMVTGVSLLVVAESELATGGEFSMSLNLTASPQVLEGPG